MGLSVDFTGDGCSPLDDSLMATPLSIPQTSSSKSAGKKNKVKDTSEVIAVSDANIDDVLFTIDEVSPRKFVENGLSSAQPLPHAADNGTTAGTTVPTVATATNVSEVMELDRVVSDESESGSCESSPSEEGGDWDDWDAESEAETEVDSKASGGGSAVDPLVTEACVFLRTLREDTPGAVSSLASLISGIPISESPFEVALHSRLTAADSFVIQWLLRVS